MTITWQRSRTGVNTPDGNGGQLPEGSQISVVTTIPVDNIQSINGTGRPARPTWPPRSGSLE